MSKSWAGGSTRRWRALRTAVLTRDQWTCRLQLPGCTTRATQVHHLAGKQAGDNPALLVSACAHCNGSVGDPTRDNPNPRPTTAW